MTLFDVSPEDPFDPICKRHASEVSEYDGAIYESQEELNATSDEDLKINRIRYVISEEGTYSRVTGHFLCDTCYIRAGMPSSPQGWVCP